MSEERRLAPALVVVGSFLVVMGLCTLATWRQINEGESARSKRLFTIAKETTYINEPRGPNGLIDYVAAVNRQLSAGVTPENNAMVLFLSAIGPSPSGEGIVIDEEIYSQLRMRRPPMDGDYYLALSDYMYRVHQTDDLESAYQFEAAISVPWKAELLPEVAEWLQHIEEPLDSIVRGSRRERFFLPVMRRTQWGKSLTPLSTGYCVVCVYECLRDCGRALAVRAMLRAGEGRIDEAWEDLMACYRLGDHLGKGSAVKHGLVGCGIEYMALARVAALLQYVQPDVEQARDWMRDLEALPPPPSTAAKIQLGIRYQFLDIVQRAASGIIPLKTGPHVNIKVAPPDWDVVMKTGNQFCDRIADAMERGDPRQRHQKLHKLQTELETLARSKPDSVLGVGHFGRVKRSHVVAAIVLLEVLGGTLPRLKDVVENIANQRRHIARVVLALAAYRSEQHDGYPRDLQELIPDYLQQIPVDIFSGESLRYQRTTNGYLLYSIGPNRKDEGGKYPSRDDIVVPERLTPETNRYLASLIAAQEAAEDARSHDAPAEAPGGTPP